MLLGDQVLDRLEREVRVDRAGAVADEQRHVVHLAGVAALDDQADLRALLLADEVVVDGGRQQQRRDRRVDRVGCCGRDSTMIRAPSSIAAETSRADRVERALRAPARRRRPG